VRNAKLEDYAPQRDRSNLLDGKLWQKEGESG